MSEATALLAEQLAEGVLDADILALVWILAESGVPLTVASPDTSAARELRNAVCSLLPPERRAADMALAGGTVAAGSLDDMLRVLGDLHADPATDEIADAARDLGLVLVLRDGRVVAAHYVRPVERDAAGHLQRRPPALLAAWSAGAPAADHYYWAITDELATRAGMDRAEFETEHAARTRRLEATLMERSSTAHRH